MPNSELDELLEEVDKHPLTANDLDTNIALSMQEVNDRIQDRVERKKYAYRTFIFLSVFTSFVLLIIIGAGFTDVINFKLSEGVLIALITSSLASIVGIFILVMRYLFR